MPMKVENCPACGGTHFGSYECPFRTAPCVVCGTMTVLACSDCAIETSESIHVCKDSACRDAHEASAHVALSATSGDEP